MQLKDYKNQFIKLRPLIMNDFEQVVKWSKDDTFCSANDWDKNRIEQELYKWWNHCVHSDFKDFIRLGIELDEMLIGYADLAHIKEHSAELGIAIGDSTLWGQGIGFVSSICMMNYAFQHLDITIFHAETHETNHRARKMLDRIGFKEVSKIGHEEYLGIETKLVQYSISFNGKITW